MSKRKVANWVLVDVKGEVTKVSVPMNRKARKAYYRTSGKLLPVMIEPFVRKGRSHG